MLNKPDTVKMRPWKWKSISVSPSSPEMRFSVRTARISACYKHNVQWTINLLAWTYTDIPVLLQQDMKIREQWGWRVKREWTREREVRKEWKEREKKFWYSLPHCQGHTKGRWRERVRVSELGGGRRRWGVWKARDSLKRMDAGMATQQFFLKRQFIHENPVFICSPPVVLNLYDILSSVEHNFILFFWRCSYNERGLEL